MPFRRLLEGVGRSQEFGFRERFAVSLNDTIKVAIFLLIAGALVRAGPGKHIGHIDPPLYATPGAGSEAEVARLTGAITDNLCRYIRQHPDPPAILSPQYTC